MDTYIHTYIHTYIQTYIKTYIQTYIHTHTYIHWSVWLRSQDSSAWLPSLIFLCCLVGKPRFQWLAGKPNFKCLAGKPRFKWLAGKPKYLCVWLGSHAASLTLSCSKVWIDHRKKWNIFFKNIKHIEVRTTWHTMVSTVMQSCCIQQNNIKPFQTAWSWLALVCSKNLWAGSSIPAVGF